MKCPSNVPTCTHELMRAQTYLNASNNSNQAPLKTPPRSYVGLSICHCRTTDVLDHGHIVELLICTIIDMSTNKICRTKKMPDRRQSNERFRTSDMSDHRYIKLVTLPQTNAHWMGNNWVLVTACVLKNNWNAVLMHLKCQTTRKYKTLKYQCT